MPELLSEAVEKIISRCRRPEDKLLIRILHNTGCELSEALGIKSRDITLNGRLFKHEENLGQGVVANELIEQLRLYNGPKRTGYVFNENYQVVSQRLRYAAREANAESTGLRLLKGKGEAGLKSSKLKEPEVRELMEPWMAQWGYVPVPVITDRENYYLPRRWNNSSKLDDLYCLSRGLGYYSQGTICPFQEKEGKSIPHNIILEYKGSKMQANEIQRAIGQAIFYQTIAKYPVYLVVDRKDLRSFSGVYHICPFGVITYSNGGEEIAVEQKARLYGRVLQSNLQEEIGLTQVTLNPVTKRFNQGG